jgi:hypothetical protein
MKPAKIALIALAVLCLLLLVGRASGFSLREGADGIPVDCSDVACSTPGQAAQPLTNDLGETKCVCYP